MLSELILLSFDKIMQTHSYTVVILGTKEKRFAIYADPSIGRVLQIYLTDTEKPRPLTHDLTSVGNSHGMPWIGAVACITSVPPLVSLNPF